MIHPDLGEFRGDSILHWILLIVMDSTSWLVDIRLINVFVVFHLDKLIDDPIEVYKLGLYLS